MRNADAVVIVLSPNSDGHVEFFFFANALSIDSN